MLKAFRVVHRSDKVFDRPDKYHYWNLVIIHCHGNLFVVMMKLGIIVNHSLDIQQLKRSAINSPRLYNVCMRTL